MKIILSRKGFDGTFGGQPSPILPDGTMLSLPIPYEDEKVSFGELKYKDNSYFDIIKQLKPRTKLKGTQKCHLDPDLRKDAISRSRNWKPLFGQADSALSHLQNEGISPGDLFLFFGTFIETEYDKDGILRYIRSKKEIHAIYGYLQVKQLHTANERIAHNFNYHPHARAYFTNKTLNGIFEATNNLSFRPNLSGAGTLNYHQDLVLTKPGESKSRWQLPLGIKNLKISYHSENSFKPEGYFQSAAIGQEFVMAEDEMAEKWAEEIILNGSIVN